MLDVLKIRAELSKLGHSIDLYSAKGLCELMKDKLSNKPEGINFFDFGYAYADKVLKEGRRIGENYRIAVSKFEAFVGNRNLCFSDITSSLLMKFEEHLKSQRSKCGIGNISDSGIIRITNNHFAKYKIPKQPITRKRSLTDEQIRAIKEYRIPKKHVGCHYCQRCVSHVFLYGCDEQSAVFQWMMWQCL